MHKVTFCMVFMLKSGKLAEKMSWLTSNVIEPKSSLAVKCHVILIALQACRKKFILNSCPLKAYKFGNT